MRQYIELTVVCLGGGSPTCRGSTTSMRNMSTPAASIIAAGTMNDHPQGLGSPSQSAQNEGMMVPKILPTEV